MMSSSSSSSSSSSRVVGHKAKGVARSEPSKRAKQGHRSKRWYWTLFIHADDSDVNYVQYPTHAGTFPVLPSTKSGPKPAPLVVSFVSYQEEVCTSTQKRHLQGYIEVGTFLLY